MYIQVFVASLFLTSIYLFKSWYLPTKQSNDTNITETEIGIEIETEAESETVCGIDGDNECIDDTNPSLNGMESLDFSKIINSADLNFSETKLSKISPRFSARKTKKIQKLRLWNMKDFWTEEMALNLSNQLFTEFMDETSRSESFYFTTNNWNEKIRGNDDIENKIEDAHRRLKNEEFTYCKYEYKRNLPLYQRVLSYLNSSYVVNLMSKVLKKEIVGVSDLFVSIYFKNNFLSIHNDRGLGHYAFVNFLSQDWDFDSNGGSLNFNCQDRNWRESCLEMKPDFNQNMLFKVWPDSINHFVKTVEVELPRIAITGWYFTTERRGVMWDSIQEETGYGLK